jgi:HEAT repeat protein
MLMVGCSCDGEDDPDGGSGGESDNPVDYYLALLAGDDLDDRWRAIQRLPNVARSARPRAIASLRKLTESESLHLRGGAAVALAKMDPLADDMMPALVDALSDRDHRVRAGAMEAIIHFGANRPDVRAIIDTAITNDEVKVRLLAVDALIGMQPRTAEITAALAGRLDDSFLMVRRQALDALLEAGLEDPDTLAVLADAINNEQRHVRLAAMETFVSADPTLDGVVATLADQLTHDDAKLAGMARDRLLALDPEVSGVTVAWGEAYNTPDHEIRRVIVERWCQVEPLPAVVELLGRAVLDKDHLTFSKAVRRLEELGPAARPAAPGLLALLDGPRWRGYIKALELLVPLTVADPTLAEPLCDALLTEDGQVREQLLEDLMVYAKHLEDLSELLAGLIARPELAETKKLAALDLLTALGGWAKPAAPILQSALQRGAPSATLRSAIETFLTHVAAAPEPSRIPRQEEH